MIWVLLALIGVPLSLCALRILALLYRDRLLRTRHGDLAVRTLRPGKNRWTRRHGIWVSNVVAWRVSPAAWNEVLQEIVDAKLGPATPEEQTRLRHLDADPAVAALTAADGALPRVATTAGPGLDLLDPFGVDARSARHSP